MESATGLRSIPTLVEGDAVVHGAEAILATSTRVTPSRRTRLGTEPSGVEWPFWVELEGSLPGTPAVRGLLRCARRRKREQTTSVSSSIAIEGSPSAAAISGPVKNASWGRATRRRS